MEILELTVQTNNLIGTEKFYGETIGFEIANKNKKCISFYSGGSKLVFESVDLEQIPKYHFAFNIPVNKINEAVNWTFLRTSLIVAAGNNFITNFENWKAQSIYFFDNNRNIVEFICRADLNNSVESTFSVHTILNINEIGLVTDNPLKMANEIIEKSKIDFFIKGPKGEDFVAVGDDRGLFVISNPNRNWYPTKERAEKQKVKAKVKVAENVFELEFN